MYSIKSFRPSNCFRQQQYNEIIHCTRQFFSGDVFVLWPKNIPSIYHLNHFAFSKLVHFAWTQFRYVQRAVCTSMCVASNRTKVIIPISMRKWIWNFNRIVLVCRLFPARPQRVQRAVLNQRLRQFSNTPNSNGTLRFGRPRMLSHIYTLHDAFADCRRMRTKSSHIIRIWNSEWAASRALHHFVYSVEYTPHQTLSYILNAGI